MSAMQFSIDGFALPTTSSNSPLAPILAGQSIRLDAIPPAIQEKLLQSSSELIVNRGTQPLAPAPESLLDRPILRSDLAHSPSKPHAQRTASNPTMQELSDASQKLRRSLHTLRDSISRLESRVQDKLFDTKQIESLQTNWMESGERHAPAKANPNADAARPKSTMASIQNSLLRLEKNARPPQEIDSVSAARDDQATRPRIWRRWVRLDRILEAQAMRWQAQASRLGMILEFQFDAPTGQEVWTDVDVILHIVDQFVAVMLSKGKRGATIAIQTSIHPEDEHWMQIAVRGSALASPDRGGLVGHPAVFAVARKFATMLGGFLDQFSGNESGVCWKFHFPVDDVLSWMQRAKLAEHQYLAEVELLASHAEALDMKHWAFADRAFQAGMDLRDRAIQIAPRRYILSSSDPFTDVSNLRKRFQLQLDRIGANLLAGHSQQFDLRCQQLGRLNDILGQIMDRIRHETQPASSKIKTQFPSSRSTPNDAKLHAPHAAPSQPKMNVEKKGEQAVPRKPTTTATFRELDYSYTSIQASKSRRRP